MRHHRPRTAATASRGLPGIERVAIRRRATRPPTSSAAPYATCCSAAGEPTSTSSSRGPSTSSRRRLGGVVRSHERFGPPRSRSTASRSTSPRPARRPTRVPARFPRSARQRWPTTSRRRDFTVNAMALAAQRRPSWSTPTAASRTSAQACCGSSTSAPSRTTRPGRFGPRATRRASDSSSSRAPRRCFASADLGTVSARAGRRRAAQARRRARAAVAGSSCSATGGCSPRARRATSIDAVVAVLERPGGVARAGRPHRGGAGSGARRSRLTAADELVAATPAAPVRGSRTRPTARAASSWSSPARAGPSGSTTTSTNGAGCASRSAGEDLLDAGVPEGPAVGRGLRAALDAKLDGEVDGRDEELAGRSRRLAGPEVTAMDWRDGDGVRCSRPSCRARWRCSPPASAASAKRRSTASTSGC